MDVILIVVSFVAVALAVLAIYSGVRDQAARRSNRSSSEAGKAGIFEIPGDLALSAASRDNANTEVPVWWDRLSLWVEQSGVRVGPSVLIGFCCTVGIISGASTLLLLNWWVAALTVPAVMLLPLVVIAFLGYQRRERLRAQLPDALDLMSRMLRAGQTIPQSLRGVADEFDAPIADEFGYCYEQQNLGLSTDASMAEMARRTGVLELRILVVALTVHRQAGGNLSELLDNLASVIRDRYRIQGQIRALTADGRMQAAILLALPPFLLVALSVLNSDYVGILFQFPWLLVGMFGFELFGALWLHRIVSFDF